MQSLKSHFPILHVSPFSQVPGKILSQSELSKVASIHPGPDIICDNNCMRYVQVSPLFLPVQGWTLNHILYLTPGPTAHWPCGNLNLHYPQLPQCPAWLLLSQSVLVAC
jgi:hypothetical protein